MHCLTPIVSGLIFFMHSFCSDFLSHFLSFAHAIKNIFHSSWMKIAGNDIAFSYLLSNRTRKKERYFVSGARIMSHDLKKWANKCVLILSGTSNKSQRQNSRTSSADTFKGNWSRATKNRTGLGYLKGRKKCESGWSFLIAGYLANCFQFSATVGNVGSD